MDPQQPHRARGSVQALTRGPALEIAAALAGAALALALLLWPPLRDGPAAIAALSALVAWIAWQDVVTLTIPDGAVAALGVIAAALRLGEAPIPAAALSIGVDVVFVGGTLWLVREVGYRRRGVDILGFGDVKLGAAGAVLAGATGFSAALLAASVTGLAAAAVARAAGHDVGAATRLPFGALLAPAILVVWLIAGTQAVLAR